MAEDVTWVIGIDELASRPELLQLPPQMGRFGLFFEDQVTLIAAREKMGKSSIATSEVLSVARRGHSVLWISRDEAYGHIVRRLALQAKDDWPRNSFGDGLLWLLYDWPESWEHMTQLVRRYDPDCVLVDSLSSVLAGLGLGIPKHSEGEEWHARLNAFRTWQRPVVILHHATKPQEGRGSHYRGSTGIGAAVDLIIEMNTPGGKGYDKRIRVLNRTGRWALPDLWVRFGGEDEGYALLDPDLLADEDTPDEPQRLAPREALEKLAAGRMTLESEVHSLAELDEVVSRITNSNVEAVRKARKRATQKGVDFVKLLTKLEGDNLGGDNSDSTSLSGCPPSQSSHET